MSQKLKDWNYFFKKAKDYFYGINAVTDPYDLSVMLESAYREGVDDVINLTGEDAD